MSSIITQSTADSTTPVTMTSLELVNFINASRKEGEAVLLHYNFMAKVPKVLGEAALKFQGSYMGKDHTTRTCYIFPKREACLMVMSYSYELQAKVFDRMTALEQQVAELQAAQQAQEQQRIAARQAARLECPALANAVIDSRAAAGKDAKGHHFSNEYDMLNRIVLGCTASKYRKQEGLEAKEALRDNLTAKQIAAIEDLQRLNTALITVGLPYEERKAKLNAHFMRKHNQAICQEVIAINT